MKYLITTHPHTKFGCNVNIKSIQEEESTTRCVDSLIICCNTNWEVMASILETSYVKETSLTEKEMLFLVLWLYKEGGFRCLSDCNWTRIHNHLVHKRTFNHLAKLAKWLSCVVSTYLYDAFHSMLLSCHVRFSEWIHTL